MNIPNENEINELYGKLDTYNHYQLLGIPQNASKADVTKAFRAMVAIWHIDRFGGANLSPADAQKVRTIFQRVNDAYRELSNPLERSRYDSKLEGRPDVGVVLAMENNFLRGRRALHDDNIPLAKKLFDEVVAALPDDPNYKFHKLYVDYLLLPKTREGRLVDKEAGEKLYHEMETLFGSYKETTDWMHEFLGVASIGLGNDKKALNFLKKAVAMNQSNLNAQRRLRLLERRKKSSDHESEGSLLDTIKGWFSSK